LIASARACAGGEHRMQPSFSILFPEMEVSRLESFSLLNTPKELRLHRLSASIP
jgi:hypothetical protein